MPDIGRGFRCKIEDYFNVSNEIIITLSVKGEISCDSCCFGVDAADKLSDDSFMVFYNQTVTPGQEIIMTGGGADTTYKINLSKLPERIQKLVFTVSIDGAGDLSHIKGLSVTAAQGISTALNFNLSGADFKHEKAIVCVEIYKKGVWRLAAVGSGFDGGLSELLKHFGGKEINVPPPPTVKPSKVELKKGQKISLEKSASGGEILINLNWSQGIPAKGLINIKKPQSIDLDLGAFIELTDGSKHVVQALGNDFGSLNAAPYVSLDGDDRTGAVSGGENLRVNGKMIAKIRRILIYTFIYEGAANWQQADGVVTVKYPGGGDIIVRMDEYGSSQGMCAIAEVTNQNGVLQVEKLVRFFTGHRDMDSAFRWGFRWKAGSK